MKKIIIPGIIVMLLVTLFAFRSHLRDAVNVLLKPQLPPEKTAVDFAKNVFPTAPPKPSTPVFADLPETVNLAVPFAPQAPFGDWSMPYQEACEEAASIMVHRYWTGEPLDATTMNAEILKLVDWENKTFGYYKDTNGAEIQRIVLEYFGHLHVELHYNPTIEEIKRQVAAGRPVIVPAAGRLLGNPNFHVPGPVYHALVIKGYTKTKIITNDPGTRNGHDYLYDPDVLMHALHEWNAQDITKGRPVMIVVFSDAKKETGQAVPSR